MYRPKAEQVRVRLDRPLTRTEQAQLTDMFSELGLGLTVTEKEISASNFSDNLSNEDFRKLTNYLLDEFNHGNAETALHNARGALENDKLSDLSGVEKENAGDGQGNIWSGTIEHRKNYSTYYEADRGTRKDGITDSGKRTNYHDFDGNPAKMLLNKHSSVANYLKQKTITNIHSETFEVGEQPLTLAAYLFLV